MGAEELGHPVDRGLERVGERELRDRLADDGEERPRPLELGGEDARAGARAQRVRRADAERGEPAEELLRRRLVAAEQELKRPDGRLSEQDGGDGARSGG